MAPPCKNKRLPFYLMPEQVRWTRYPRFRSKLLCAFHDNICMEQAFHYGWEALPL